MKIFKKIPIGTIVIIGVVVSFLLFVVQLRINAPLKEELGKRKAEKKDAEDSVRYLKELEKKREDLDAREEDVYAIIPLNEQKPITLIKDLIALSKELHLGAFTIADQPLEDEFDKKSKKKKEYRHSVLKVGFEADFQQVMLFLQRLSQFKRLAYPKEINMERIEEILPRQKVTLQIVTYSF